MSDEYLDAKVTDFCQRMGITAEQHKKDIEACKKMGLTPEREIYQLGLERENCKTEKELLLNEKKFLEMLIKDSKVDPKKRAEAVKAGLVSATPTESSWDSRLKEINDKLKTMK